MAPRFKKNKVSRDASLGEELTRLRESKHLTRGALARKTGVAEKYLLAFETNELAVLPSLMYAKKFLSRVRSELSGGGNLQTLLREDWRLTFPKTHTNAFVPRASRRALLVAPRLVRIGAGLIAAVLLFVVLIAQANARLRPPPLTVNLPEGGFVSHVPSFYLQGKTEPEAAVTVNGAPLLPDRNGKFEDRIDLERGVNQLRIAVSKPQTGEKVLLRYIVYQP